MRLCEMESAFLNQQKSDSQISSEMDRAANILNNDLDFGNPKVIDMIKESL